MDAAAGFSFSTAVSHNFSPIPSPSSASSFSGSLPSSPPLTPGVYSLLSPHHPYATPSSSPCRATTAPSSSSSSSWPFRGFEAAPFRGAIQTYDEVFQGFTTRKAARATAEYSTDTDTRTDTYTDMDTDMGTETCAGAGTETESVAAGAKRSYYSLLGVPKSAAAADIRQAYRALALQLHPDIAPLHQLDTTTRLFAQINEAYAVLSDPQARARYDLKLALESTSPPLSTSPAVRYRNEKMRNSPVTSPRAYPPFESFYRAHRSGTKNWETDQCWS